MERKARQPNEQLIKKIEIYLKKKKLEDGKTNSKRRDFGK